MRQYREKPHTRFRLLMDSYGIQGTDIAEWIGHSPNYVSYRMLGRQPWTIEEIYIIADHLNRLDPDEEPLPYSEIYKYFPLNGIRQKQ